MKKFLSLFIVLGMLCFPVKADALSVSAKAAVVINGDSGEIIFEKNAHTRMSMASTTKIMTGLLLCEYGNFDKEITVTEEMLKVEGSSMGLLPGDRVTLHDLLYGLLLASGNDAANVIATVIGGSVDGFVKMMNERAKTMGLESTSFATPSGLDAENHYTTAYELAVVAEKAMENEEFAAAVSTKKAILNYGNPPYRRSLTNHNKLLGMDENFVGIKTGFTKKSGRCLVSAMKKDSKYVICVTLNAPDDWNDHKALSNYGISQIEQAEFIPEDAYSIPVIGADNNLTVKLNSFCVNTQDSENIEFEIKLPSFLYAPIQKGEEIGSIQYKKDGEVLGEKAITAEKSISAENDSLGFTERLFMNINMILGEINEG